ncbi:hypothetical protein [Sphingomonas sanxanigenens]|uniref:hypothetical protein n=1 Tax=Sphingomonas sanxanigenens TaxID=397260 RepID=UPI001300D284|nr:hypothetical protein [Sphingomonas sanxanigenens]
MALILLLTAYWTYLILCCGFALWRGGPPERIAAWGMIAASVLTIFAADPDGYVQVEYAVLAIDVALLALLVALAIVADRRWTLWAAGFHLVGVLTPIAFMLSPTAIRFAYAWMQGFWAYPTLTALLAGTIAYRRRVKRGTAGRSWRPFSRRSARTRPAVPPAG